MTTQEIEEQAKAIAEEFEQKLLGGRMRRYVLADDIAKLARLIEALAKQADSAQPRPGPMLEKVARALCADLKALDFDESPPAIQQMWRDVACAIFVSLREPTDAMIEAGRQKTYTKEKWQAMIDVALREPSK